jgi:large subunit ribosomal protein L11
VCSLLQEIKSFVSVKKISRKLYEKSWQINLQKNYITIYSSALLSGHWNQRFTENYNNMAKKPTKVVKLQLKAGQANPAPPVGTALGPTGIQIAEFCKQFNDRTKDQMGTVLPTVINIYEDRTFDFYTKQPPMTYLIKTELSLKSGSKLPHKEKVAHLTDAQLEKIANAKMADLNCYDIDMAKSIVAGSARSMGITSDLKK